MLSSEQEPIWCEQHKADHRVLVECWMFAALGWICSGVLTRMVTLWICLNRFTVQSALWMTLHYITSALLKNNWICTKSHGHSVRPDASCDSAGVIVCPVYLCVFLCTRKCVKCVLLSFLGLPSFTHSCWMSDGDSLFTFPSSACQWLQCGLSAQQAPYINLIPIWSSSDQLRDHLTALSWLFHFHRSGALRLVISFILEFAVRMLREDVLHTCDV